MKIDEEKIDLLLQETIELLKEIENLKSLTELKIESTKKKNNLFYGKEDTENVKKIRFECYEKKLYSAKIKRVPLNYYDNPLEFRRDVLGAT
jgi:hypothetical protein